jgi:hypothetical protein
LIRNTGKQVFSTQFNTSKRGIKIVMSTHPRSTDNLPFRIIASGICSIPLMGHLFSEALATVEDAFLVSPFDLESLSSSFKGSCAFFTSLRSVRTTRASPGIEQGIGDIFYVEGLPLDILPSLEEIQLNAATKPSRTSIRIGENQVACKSTSAA